MPDITASATARAGQITELWSCAPAPDNHDGVREYLRRAAGLGCAPLLVLPGTKVPFDGRAPRQRIADDRAAQGAAKAAGNANWAKVKSPAGVHLATADTAMLDGYLDEYLTAYGPVYPDGVPVNVAVSVGGSGLLVVDCDTAEQLAGFLARAGAPPGTEPTVRSPGQRDLRTGEMTHKDGGHFYFTVPS